MSGVPVGLFVLFSFVQASNILSGKMKTINLKLIVGIFWPFSLPHLTVDACGRFIENSTAGPGGTFCLTQAKIQRTIRNAKNVNTFR